MRLVTAECTRACDGHASVPVAQTSFDWAVLMQLCICPEHGRTSALLGLAEANRGFLDPCIRAHHLDLHFYASLLDQPPHARQQLPLTCQNTQLVISTSKQESLQTNLSHRPLPSFLR